MTQNTETDPEVLAAHEALKATLAEFGDKDIRAAVRMEEYAKVLRSKDIRKLDAVNLEARAKVIRESNPTDAGSKKECKFCAEQIDAGAAVCPLCNSQLVTGPVATATVEATKKCPYCAEEIKAEAKICKHCKSELADARPRLAMSNQATKGHQSFALTTSSNSGLSDAEFTRILRSLSSKELAIYTAELDRRKSTVGVACLLCIFLGLLGAHKFYVGKPGEGVAYIVLLFLSALVIPALILMIVLIVDLFTLPGQVRAKNDQIAREVLSRLGAC